MTPDAIQLHLEEAATMVPHLEEAATMVPHLEEAATMVPHLEEAGPLDTVRGAAYVVSGRIPMISTTGRPPVPNASPWGLGGGTVYPVIMNAAAELRNPEPHHYVPGPLRPQNGPDGWTFDTIRVTDSLGTHRDVHPYFREGYGPAPQTLEVAIGTDGVAAMVSGGYLELIGTGGAEFYTWEFVHNRTGATLTPVATGAAYVAGPNVGIDRLRVTDSLGEIGLVQVEVLAGQIAADMVVLPEDVPNDYRHNVFGWHCQPYANVWGVNGTAPYTVALVDNQTGATIEPPRSRRAAFILLDMAGAPLDLTGWAFDARLYGQRGGVLASGLAVSVSGNVVEVDIPEPGALLFTPAVLRVEAETAGSILATGYPTVALEALLVTQEA